MRLPSSRLVAALALAVTSLSVSALPQDPPDLTRGDRIPEKATHDWNLGATGARGWMHSYKMGTHQARQIAVTEVAKGSPADGVLDVGDVLLGVGGKRFASDPRTEFGQALTRAEQRGGRLQLLRWRDGAHKAVTVMLPVLGAYSATAPYDCPKSERILEQGCEVLAANMQRQGYRPNPIPRCLNALALLASGDEEYLPLVRREVEWASSFSAKSFQTWYYGYVLMLLAEYHMVTGDDSVMEGMRRLALDAAEGQSMVGSWGHKFARPDGRLAGYGMMNAPGVPLTAALVMVREAGLRDPRIDKAIDRSVKLLRFYVNKGAIPYGDHHPWIQTHEDNGKCSMGAVLFDRIGDARAATYFSRMSVSSHGPERDQGHTGNFFNVMWALPAISLSGPRATGGWMKEFGARYFDMARCHDGSFRHQGPPEPKPDKYARWDATGAYLLSYALPRRKLLLTGRAPTTVPTLDNTEVAALLEGGRGWTNVDRTSYYDGMTEDDLLQRLSSWSPIVRERAAEALGRRKSRAIPQLIELLEGDSLNGRIGACQALGQLRGAGVAAVPALVKAMDASDLWLRVKAAEALARMGKPALSALPILLDRMAARSDDDDPRAMEQRYLSFSLFDRRNGMLRRSLEGADLETLYTAVRAGLQNQDGRARSAVGNIYEQLTFEQVQPLLPAIHTAIMESSPSGIMFADGIRTSGLKILAKYRVRQGIEACAHYVRHMKKHGSQKRVPKVLTILKGYGVHAQAVVEDLEATARYFETSEEGFPKKLSRQKAQAVRDAIREIEASTERPKLMDLR